jgi:hypothetical protein
MRIHLTLFGGSLLDLVIGDEEPTSEADERLTFGFASVTGITDIDADGRMLDTSDRKAR